MNYLSSKEYDLMFEGEYEQWLIKQLNNMITEKQMEILHYIHQNGNVDVKVTPRIIRQNDALYERIWKLEVLGAITVKRRIGIYSLLSLTEHGHNLIIEDKIKNILS
jgi:hypothetical protein